MDVLSTLIFEYLLRNCVVWAICLRRRHDIGGAAPTLPIQKPHIILPDEGEEEEASDEGLWHLVEPKRRRP